MAQGPADDMPDELDNTEVEEDVEMEGGGDIEIIDVESAPVPENGGDNLPPVDESVEQAVPARQTYLDHLTSPIIELSVGSGDELIVLSAHQSLLTQSPFFAEACAAFSDNAVVKRINMPNESLDAVGCFLEYIYTGEYFPRRVDGSRTLEPDVSIPVKDEDGTQLLKHARVYTLADKLGMKALQALSRSKIHSVESSAKGEIAYARYVYGNTPPEDITIRKPIAAYWAQQSHLLRKGAEVEFRSMCLEFPQFGFDVLTRVLDEKARREEKYAQEKSSSTPGTARKRSRNN